MLSPFNLQNSHLTATPGTGFKDSCQKDCMFLFKVKLVILLFFIHSFIHSPNSDLLRNFYTRQQALLEDIGMNKIDKIPA